MNSLSIIKIDKNYTEIYNTFLKSIYNINKLFNYTNKDLYIINNGHIDIGVILVNNQEDKTIIELYQAPRVCRLSVISLIESSVLISKKIISKSIVCFNLFNLNNYLFKFKVIFKNGQISENEESIEVSSLLIEQLKVEDITFRDITYLEF